MGRKQSQHLPEKKLITIYTEGETEKIYFSKLKSKLRKSNLKINIKNSSGKSSENLAKYAEKAEKKKSKGEKSDFIFLIFDKDENDLDEVGRVLKEHKERVGFCNESFELWLLLHYVEINTPFKREELLKKIKNIHPQYEKTNERIIEEIVSFFEIALENSEKISNADFRVNPYCNMEEVIKKLREC